MRIRKRRESLYHWRFPDPQILLKRPKNSNLAALDNDTSTLYVLDSNA